MVFGAGGDRDAGKRPIMGRIAAENADRVIVTDDNPRSEQPAAIRAAILAAAPGATEIGDRAEAIRAGIAALKAGDVLLIAGKGHETGQIIGDTHVAVFRPRRGRRGVAGQGGMSALWTIDDMAAAMRAEKSGALPADVPGMSIDSRSIAKGEAFFAIQGDNRDGHDFVEAALKAGAGVAVVARDKRAQFAADAPLLIVADVLEALRDLGARRARALARQGHRRHRLGRQDRHQGGAAAGALAPTAKPMPRPPPTTIIGACRCRSPAVRRARNTRCSRSA